MSAANTGARIAIIEAAERTEAERVRREMAALVDRARADGIAEGKREAAAELEGEMLHRFDRLDGSLDIKALLALVLRWRGTPREPAATVEARIRRGWPGTAKLARLAETTPEEAAHAETHDDG